MESSKQLDQSLFKRFIKRASYYYDIFMAILLIIPMFLQWIITYVFLSKKKSVKDKVVLITGGAGGLGKATALKFASLGCKIAIIDINKNLGNQAVKEILKLGAYAKFYQVDITKADDILQLRREVEKEFDAVDILINNAGIVTVKNLEEDSCQIESIVKVNLLGMILMTKCFLEKMISQGSGHIVSISSMSGLHPSPFIIPYTATKFGVNGFMQGLNEHLRIENLGDKIKTTCIFPFYIKTVPDVEKFLNPNMRYKALEVDDAANQVVDAILKEKTSVTIPGHHEIVLRLVHILPLKLQEKLFRDRVLREYEFKNTNF